MNEATQQPPQFLTEADVFRFLREQMEKNNLGALTASVNAAPHPGDYVAAFDRHMNCKTAQTVSEAVARFPAPMQQVQEMNAQAAKLEQEASELRANAAKILGETNLHDILHPE